MNDTPAPPKSRSAGMRRVARAIWYTRPGAAEIRTQTISVPREGQALVKMLYSGISRGTERLVLAGKVPEAERARMRAPLQEGEFPFPVKYGYCGVGVVEAGPKELAGQRVFCLHPHQDYFLAPVGMLLPIPDAVPSLRATLAANMETALNAVWDAGAGAGDRITVVGAGIVGLMVTALTARLPGAEVTVIDVAAERQQLVERLGARFVTAERWGQNTHGSDPASGADVVFHTSASSAGLESAIAAAGREATVIEMSWYGDRDVAVKLGGSFHSQRIKLVSSQVGLVSPGHRPRWDYARRLTAALRLLDDPRLDALVAEEIRFEDCPQRLPEILGPDATGLAPVIRYASP